VIAQRLRARAASRSVGRVAHPVVREGTDAQGAGADAPDRLEHARPRHARFGDGGHEAPGIDGSAPRPAFRFEGRAERRDRELAPLEPRSPRSPASTTARLIAPGSMLCSRSYRAIA